MHDTASRIVPLALEIYAGPNSRVLEIGSYDALGSLRQAAHEGVEYVRIDIQKSSGVDKVFELGKPIPVEDNYFDLVLGSSVFEHDNAFWMTFIDICRKIRPGGHYLLTAPSNSQVYRYPDDVWRFYPDAGCELVEWATTQGQKIELVESFIAEEGSNGPNDFVAVFRKMGGHDVALARTIQEFVPCTSVLLGKAKEYQNLKSGIEDRIVLAKLRADAIETAAQLDVLRRQTAVLSEEAAAMRKRAGVAEAAYSAETANVAELERSLGVSKAALEQSRFRISDLESELAQRHEEIAQTLSQMREAENRAEALEAEADKLRQKLIESEAWVFRLAGERQAAESAQVAAISRAKQAERQLRTSLVENEVLVGKLNDVRKHAGVIPKDRESEPVARLQETLEQRDRALEAANVALRQAEGSVGERFAELATLTRALQQKQGDAEAVRQKVVWLQRVSVVSMGFPKWWAILPTFYRRKLEYGRYARKGLFNAAKYLALYPDVAESAMDPLRHYILHGINEGRSFPD